MHDPRKLRKIVYIPVAFSFLLVAQNAVMRALKPGAALDLWLWFLPMCFFFVAATQHMLLLRIEALEAKPHTKVDAA